MGCSDLLAGAHEQGIGAITDRGIGPDAAYKSCWTTANSA